MAGCDQDTPLHDAAINSHVDIVDILLRSNADLVGDMFTRILCSRFAAQVRARVCMCVCVCARARVAVTRFCCCALQNATNKKGFTPLDVATDLDAIKLLEAAGGTIAKSSACTVHRWLHTCLLLCCVCARKAHFNAPVCLTFP